MVAPKMAVPLKLVVLLMLVICLRRAWYSVLMAVDCEGAEAGVGGLGGQGDGAVE